MIIKVNHKKKKNRKIRQRIRIHLQRMILKNFLNKAVKLMIYQMNDIDIFFFVFAPKKIILTNLNIKIKYEEFQYLFFKNLISFISIRT